MKEVPLETSVQTLKEMRDQNTPHLVLDVREQKEFDTAKIEGAKLVPMGTLPECCLDIPKDIPVIVHCHHGGRSGRAVKWLRENGYVNCSNLTGGIDAWSCEIDANVARY